MLVNKENCTLKLIDEIILYYDARSKKYQKTCPVSAELCAVWCMCLFEDVDVCNRHVRLEHDNNFSLIDVPRAKLRTKTVPHRHIKKPKQCEWGWFTRTETCCQICIDDYTGCFTTWGHYCRRWFPRSSWSIKFI